MLTKHENGKLKGFGTFLREEEGMGTVEIILIIVVLIGLVIIFKTQLRSLVKKVFEKITKDSNTVME
ncbi:MAG: Flp1 family type IVb pilin [Lachnospiraceae bacterium]|nr:Flp1 family type IVb pilin [Lachnospiraceae bacterium]